MANIPGRVTKVYAKEGDSVELGDNLVVLESMKMEHIIKANKTGQVKEVFAVSGETVEAGQVLVVIK